MNNKGQTLIIFVILLPIILLLVCSIIEIGNFMVIKIKYQNEVKHAIEYGLKNNDENVKEKISNLLDANIGGTKEILVNDNQIRIKVIDKVDGIFSDITKFNYDIDISYMGYKENDKIKINKD